MGKTALGSKFLNAGNDGMVDAATGPYMVLIMIFAFVIIIGVYLFAYNIYKTMSSKT